MVVRHVILLVDPLLQYADILYTYAGQQNALFDNVPLWSTRQMPSASVFDHYPSTALPTPSSSPAADHRLSQRLSQRHGKLNDHKLLINAMIYGRAMIAHNNYLFKIVVHESTMAGWPGRPAWQREVTAVTVAYHTAAIKAYDAPATVNDRTHRLQSMQTNSPSNLCHQTDRTK